jgi:hypothetical protein
MGKRVQLSVVWRHLWEWLVTLVIAVPMLMGINAILHWFFFNARLGDWLVIPVFFLLGGAAFFTLYFLGKSK